MLFEICSPGSFAICGEASCVLTCVRQVLGYSGFMKDRYGVFERPEANVLVCFGVFIVARRSDLAAGACRIG